MPTQTVPVAPDTFLVAGSLLILGDELVLVDPTAGVPADVDGSVSWVFLSGRGARARAPLHRWPQATVVAPPAIRDGGWFEAGDRTLLALRVPASESLGLLDLATGVFWAPDGGLAATLASGGEPADLASPRTWAEAERFGAGLERLRAARPSTLVGASGEVVRGAAVDRALAALASVPFAAPLAA